MLVSNFDTSPISNFDVSNFDTSKFDIGDVSKFDTSMYQNLTPNNNNRITKKEEGKRGGPAPNSLTNSDLQKSSEQVVNPIGNSSLTSHEVDLLFNEFWREYSSFNPQGEAEARREFRNLLGNKPYSEVNQITDDMSMKLADFISRCEDGGEVNKKYVPTFANWLRKNYE